VDSGDNWHGETLPADGHSCRFDLAAYDAGMWGRFLNRIPAAETARIFGTKNELPNYPARYNIAPTDGVLAVRYNPDKRERSLDLLRWGLVRLFAKDLSAGARAINARAETSSVSSLPERTIPWSTPSCRGS
jgi:hypothetical protein